MGSAFYLSSIQKLLRWAQAQSLWYFPVSSGCCADEVLSALGCRYDLERFGMLRQESPLHSDLLIVSGAVSYKSATELKSVYQAMRPPKFVMAMGACASSGGVFGPKMGYSVLGELEKLFPVDVFVPGCPPRPEAIMNGLIVLQERISGKKRSSRQSN